MLYGASIAGLALCLWVWPFTGLAKPELPILVAIIDDSIDTAHPNIADYVWRNPGEAVNNQLDDEANGYIDDIHGFDVADLDADPNPPIDRLQDYSHGTYIAGIFVQTLETLLAGTASERVRIVPIKAVNDTASDQAIKHGYAGINYALAVGAKVVVNAWSGGELKREHALILQKAQAADTLIFNAVGNFLSQAPMAPAFHPAVFGIGNANQEGVLTKSNFGREVDLLAVGTDVPGIDIANGNELRRDTGTSVATAIVSATAVAMLLRNSELSRQDIWDCLWLTARQVEHRNPMQAGKIGAGLLNQLAALSCAEDPNTWRSRSGHFNPRGAIGTQVKRSKRKQTFDWTLQPVGVYQGLELVPAFAGEPGDSELTITSAGGIEAVAWSGKLVDIPERIRVDASSAVAKLTVKRARNLHFRAGYSAIPIDFEARYCSGETEVRGNTVLGDGSKQLPYVANSDCRWIIHSEPGKSLRLSFELFRLDPSDKLYLFTGTGTQQTNLIGTFSGDEQPPVVEVDRGPVLLWFVTDSEQQAEGFSLRVSQIEPDQRQ